MTQSLKSSSSFPSGEMPAHGASPVPTSLTPVHGCGEVFSVTSTWLLEAFTHTHTLTHTHIHVVYEGGNLA